MHYKEIETIFFRHASVQRKFNNSTTIIIILIIIKYALILMPPQNQLVRENFRENILDTNNKIMNGR